MPHKASDSQTTPVLVTGAAGFIGFHIARRLLETGTPVVGIDNINSYYDPRLKQARLAVLEGKEGFRFQKLDLADRDATAELFATLRPRQVVHMAAQAGVRYSLSNPHAYADSNLLGFLNVLEGCRHCGAEHLLYASSSSVYGANAALPFRVGDNVDHPLSLYAATKKANELMAHTYSHLYGLPTTGLRFFTVYGPWGRPDMAIFLFTDAILHGRPIDVFNNGAMRRDFTYIDDVTEAVLRLIDKPAAPNPAWNAEAPDPATSLAPYRIYNIGNSEPVGLLDLIDVVEAACGRKAVRNFLPMQAGDVKATYADVAALKQAVDFAPRTPVDEGVRRFVTWYSDIYLRQIAPNNEMCGDSSPAL
ncbi:NAD-dependent epimerase [Ancylobacter sp. 6x-1]|uniref:NAD-dependent epimerase n=1 Tax=Ancylobacter crimeensis TaxID=2579147 RepID=A0ABT0D6N3_9HYPH|nr:NAD-dependent epimerase [Ancylobacter crimeensis]MCK0195612.1 NAD-dependent epimerase [Ancylobacter crimeensis]